MKIEFLGTRGNIEVSAPGNSKHSGVLVDEKILFDLGEKEFLDRKPNYIFITHLHADHAFFMNREIGDLGVVPIFAPEKNARFPEIKVISQTVTAATYRVTSIPTIHSQKVKSTAYLVEDGSRRLLYTGDLIGIDLECRSLIGDLDLVITDGSFMRRGGLIRRDKVAGNLYGHNGIPDLVDLFRVFANRIVFTHFGSWFFSDPDSSKKMIRMLGDGVMVEAASDGLIIDI